MVYLGNDPERDILLEILIDKALLDADSSPFADIRRLSTFPEEEVLISMGAMLQIHSVKIDSEKKFTRIQLRLCFEESTEMKELKTFYFRDIIHDGLDESNYVSLLLCLLLGTYQLDKAEQFMKVIGSNDYITTKYELCRFFLRLERLRSCPENIDDNKFDLKEASEKLFQMTEDLLSRQHSDQELLNSLFMLYQSLKGLMSSKDSSNENNSEKSSSYLFESTFPAMERFFASLSVPHADPIWSHLQLVKASVTPIHNRVEALECYERYRTSPSASVFNVNAPIFPSLIARINQSESQLHDDDRSFQILEDYHNSAKPQAKPLFLLAKRHQKQGDLPMAIAYYQTIIEQCDLSPNSMDIVLAHCYIATAFFQLHHFELALFHSHRARSLILQHHGSMHPALACLQSMIQTIEPFQNIQNLSNSSNN